MRSYRIQQSIVVVCFALLASVLVARAHAQSSTQASRGWTIPATAATEKNPLTINDALIAGGKKLFASKCQRCHGPQGQGDGEDADAKYKDDMNLTNPAHAAANSDGVVFYKIWNGRSSPKMPAFSESLTKDQVWTIVAYVQTLRHPR